MKVSSKGEYGIRALFDLAQHYGRSPVTSAAIAARQQIPEAYLHRLLITLRKAGLVRSVRGPQGGHLLARPPAYISLADAVLALEGSLSPVGWRDAPASPDGPSEADVLRDVWHQVEATIGQMLESITLEDLCQRKLARERRIMYYI